MPAFAAPAIIRDWGIPRAAMGLVFGAGLLTLVVVFAVVFRGTRAGWLLPTVFVGVDNRMRIAREEIFGRVLATTHFARRDVDAIVGGRFLVDRLFLRLHDIGQRDIARFVQAQIGGHDRRHLDRDRLQAAVDLTRDRKHPQVQRRRCPAMPTALRIPDAYTRRPLPSGANSSTSLAAPQASPECTPIAA